jgi:2-dehydropantoate 2-reductase
MERPAIAVTSNRGNIIMTQKAPRIAIMGTGGVGGYFGAKLATAGYPVTFIARGAHLAAIQEKGLQILSSKGNLLVTHANITNDPAAVGPIDYVFFCVKLYDTESAGNAIRPMIGPKTGVISLQNGVDSEDRLIPILGREHVMGGAAYIAAAIEAPGIIRQKGLFTRMVFGELDGGRSPRAKALLAACLAADIDAVLETDIDRVVWTKFVLLSAFSGIASIARAPIGILRSDTDSMRLLTDAMHETAAVGRACGVALDANVVEKHLAQIPKLDQGMKPSLLHDLEHGARLEIASLSGTVARLGIEMGVDTPIHRTIYAALKHLEGGTAKN